LEFEHDDIYYIVGIKSGVNWGNSDQLNRMRDNFKAALSFLRGQGVKKEIVAVNGCIYGKDASPFKKNVDADKSYYKYASQDFWNFISGDDNLYREIIRPIDEEARARDEEFKRTYDGKVNSMVKEFSNIFLSNEGLIDWVKLIDHVSGRGKSGIAFPKVTKLDECMEYFRKKEEDKERLKEEKKKKEETKRKMRRKGI
jgi:hypothetical protein